MRGQKNKLSNNSTVDGFPSNYCGRKTVMSLTANMSPLIPPWIRKHMPSNVWDEIIYPFPNFNGATVEV